MRYRALLREKSTGKEAWSEWMESEGYEYGSAEALAIFMWTDGNMGCDCNRRRYFSDEGCSDHGACGDSEFELVRLEKDDGTEVTE